MTIFDYILLSISGICFGALLFALSSVPLFLIGTPQVGRQVRRRITWIVIPLLIVAYRVWG